MLRCDRIVGRLPCAKEGERELSGRPASSHRANLAQRLWRGGSRLSPSSGSCKPHLGFLSFRGAPTLGIPDASSVLLR